MTRLLMSLVLIAACGGSKKPKDTGPGSGTGSGPAIYVKKIVLSWGITPKGELADIFLATTDETGKQVSHSVGSYKGTCTAFKPAAEMNAITGVKCETGGGGTEIHAMVQGGEEIVVLSVGVDQGRAADPMARKEVSRVRIPLGIAVEAGN
ncbi:MAG: hypothetical protein M4D80_29400 [Myxococcota bacterium]|nr:hypothetical protein [Deltaproteobacteria bacterium]MDQ3339300.1 hypothetical protein [Myxococcota bacterium]